MTTNNDGWIKMSERKPDKFPVWYFRSEDGLIILMDYETSYNTFTHWQPATLPAPPKKELTQREKDEEAFVYTAGNNTPLGAWHAALAYRDRQNAEDLGNVLCMPEGKTSVPHLEAVTNLRRRCGLDT